MKITLSPNGITVDEFAEPSTGPNHGPGPGDLLRELADADELRLRGLIEEGLISIEEADAEGDRIKRLRDGAFAARDEAIEEERTRLSRANAQKAAAFWEPWEARFLELRGEGLSQRKACEAIEAEMRDQGEARSLGAIRNRMNKLGG